MTRSNWENRGTATVLIMPGLVLIVMLFVTTLREPASAPARGRASEAGNVPGH